MIFKPIYILGFSGTIFLINTYISTFLLKKEEEEEKKRKRKKRKKEKKKRRRRREGERERKQQQQQQRTASQISDSKPFNIFKTRTLNIRKAKNRKKKRQLYNKKTSKE